MLSDRPFIHPGAVLPGSGRRVKTTRALILARIALALLAGGTVATAAPAQAEQSAATTAVGREIRIGIVQHDLNGYGGSENGADVVLELRGAPLVGRGWDFLLRPRPHIGANINTGGETSSLYAGLTWTVPTSGALYLSADFGAAVHNGRLDDDGPGRAALGSRVLFREAAEIGLHIGESWSVGLRIDHMSNADLATPNDGITTIGPVITRRF